MIHRIGAATGAATLALLAAAGPADALFEVRISGYSGGGSLTFSDCISPSVCSTDDTDDATGVISFESGSTGQTFGNWTNVQIQANSKPDLGSVSYRELSTNVTVDSSQAAAVATLKIEVTDTDFLLPDLSSYIAQAVLTTNQFEAQDGTVTVSSYWDPSNTAFGTAHLIDDLTNSPPPNFSGVDSGQVLFAGGSPFSITHVIEFSHLLDDQLSDANAQTSVSGVPVPAALPLLVGAIGVFAALRRRA